MSETLSSLESLYTHVILAMYEITCQAQELLIHVSEADMTPVAKTTAVSNHSENRSLDRKKVCYF